MNPWEVEDHNTYSRRERQIITAMVVNDECLKAISVVYKPQYMTSKATRLIADWCIDFYSQYQSAPKTLIMDIYEAKKSNGLDMAEAAIISDFLTSVSKDYEQLENFNESYYIDQTINYFKHRGLFILSEDIQKWLTAGNTTQAQAALAKFQLPNTISSPGREPFIDMECCRQAFETLEDNLFEIPGAFGKLLRPVYRGSLVGLSALYKTGKSFLMDYISVQAWYSRLNVAIFDLEMGKEKRDRRLFQAITGLPLRVPDSGLLTVPCWDCELNQKGMCNRRDRQNHIAIRNEQGELISRTIPAGYRPCHIDDCDGFKVAIWHREEKVSPITWQKAWHKAQHLISDLGNARFKVQSLPANHAYLEDIEAHLDIWESVEGFVPDVLVIDYPALLKVKGNLQPRDRVDTIWSTLRGLSQKRNCYLLAATQAGGKETIKRRDQGRDLGQGDVAEDSRIIGHVEAMLKIDQTEEENELGVVRVSKSAERHEDYKISKQVIVLQVLAAGQAVLDSKWKWAH